MNGGGFGLLINLIGGNHRWRIRRLGIRPVRYCNCRYPGQSYYFCYRGCLTAVDRFFLQETSQSRYLIYRSSINRFKLIRFMETNHSKFWMGLGLGSIIGAVVYHFSCSSRGKQLKEKVRHAFHKAGDNAEELVDEAKDKALQTGTKVADKVADGTFNLAGKSR